MRSFIVGGLLLLGACQSQGKPAPAGVWKMGSLSNPASSMEEQFPGAAWAEGVQGGSFVGLSDDGKIYSGIPNEGPALDGFWKDSIVQFSFSGESEKKLSMTTSFSGTYDAPRDTIQGRLSQKIEISADITLEYAGDLSFSRVPQ